MNEEEDNGGQQGSSDPPETKPDTQETLLDGLEKVVSGGQDAEGSEPPVGATGATGATGQAEPPKEPTPEEKAAAELKAKDDAEIKKHGIKNEAGAKRFRELSAEARKVPELTKEVERLKPMAEQAERINALFADTGAQPDQIGTMLRYLKAVNSGDPAEMNKAADTIWAEVQHMFKLLGRSIPGMDTLAEHPDLAAEIEAGTLTHERAREIVQTRARGKLDEQQRQQRETRQSAEAAQKKVVDNALAEVNAFGAEKQKSDPHYKAKVQKLMDDGTFDGIKEDVHPSKWAQALKRAYAALPDPKPDPVPGHVPLRPTGSGTGAVMKPAPKDALEAAEMGLLAGGGRLA